MGEDEEGTLARLKAIRREVCDPKIKEHRGRIVKTTGDGLLVEFPSVVDAVRCAVEVQRGMIARNAAAHEQVRDRLDLAFDDLGEQQVKNITRLVRTYGIALGAPSKRSAQR